MRSLQYRNVLLWITAHAVEVSGSYSEIRSTAWEVFVRLLAFGIKGRYPSMFDFENDAIALEFLLFT